MEKNEILIRTTKHGEEWFSREYFSDMGRKGGKKSRRVLTSEQARAMVKAREDKKKVSRS
jgi:hypothetical protein